MWRDAGAWRRLVVVCIKIAVVITSARPLGLAGSFSTLAMMIGLAACIDSSSSSSPVGTLELREGRDREEAAGGADEFR